MIFRFSVVMAALSLAGCATITRGTNDVLVVESTPQAAQVKLSNGQSCDGTPCSFKLPRKSERISWSARKVASLSMCM
ncbi:hypothetical protein [Paracoccus yeei]|uniref:hypothetical protein n=1 Tax=Paracoccus yeei TaxID=147645 RepID=UPI001E4B693D|nr:hypothetical protein [Paracoccus yeei]